MTTMTTTPTRGAGHGHRDVLQLLVTGWTSVALLALFRDVHDLFRPGLLDQMRAGVVDGTPVTDSVLVAGGVGVLVVVAMPVLLRAAPWRIARPAAVALAPVTAVVLLANGLHDADDVMFAVAQVALLAWLGVTAFRHRPEPSPRA